MLCIRKDKEATEEALQQLSAFVSEHETYIVKPIYAAFGKGVHMDSIKNYASVEEAFQEYTRTGAVI